MAGARPDTWMPMFWGDYLKDTGHLSTLEHGAYLLLIGHYWASGAPLPDDDAKLRRIAKMESPAQWKKIRPTVAAFFQVAGGIWRHGRVDKELGSALKRSADAKAKAEKAAKARWEGQHDDIPEADQGAGYEEAPSNPPSTASGNSPSMPGALLEDCPPQPQSSSPSPVIVEIPTVEAASSVSACATAEPQKAAAAEDDLVIPPFLRRSPDGRAAQDQALAAWNAAADQHGLRRIDYLTSTRRFRLDRIFAICGGIDGFRAAIDRAPSQKFLRTANDGWQPWFSFDWLLDEDKFTRLMEGTYAERHRDNGKQSNTTDALAALAEFGRTGSG